MKSRPLIISKLLTVSNFICTKLPHVWQNRSAQQQLIVLWTKVLYGTRFQTTLFLLLGLDVVLKYLLVNLGFGEFKINTGISFSILFNSNFTLILHLVALSLLTFGYSMFAKKLNWLQNKNYFLLILLGGTINLSDRIFYGGVVDYLNFYLFKNNLSDVVIFISVVFLVLRIHKFPMRNL